MAGQWLDDFSLYGIGGQALLTQGSVYANANGCTIIADPDPSGSGAPVLSVNFNIDAGSLLRKVLKSPQTTIGFSGRYWLGGIPDRESDRPVFCTFRDISNNMHGWVQVNPSGYLEVYRTGVGGSFSGTLLGISDIPVITANTWRQVAVKWVLDDADGSVEVRVEDFTKILVTGVKTTSEVVGAGKTCASVSFQHNGLSTTQVGIYALKDLYVWDGTGALNNSFPGAASVARLDPNADISFPWTPSSGATGYNLLTNRPPLDDSAYIQAPYPPPAASIFGLTDLPANAVVALFCQPVFRGRKTDGGAGNVQLSLISGGTTGAGTEDPMSTAWSFYNDGYDADPATGDAWMVGAVNAMELQLDRTV